MSRFEINHFFIKNSIKIISSGIDVLKFKSTISIIKNSEIYSKPFTIEHTI